MKELEIQSILDERNRIADQEQMKKNAQKYRAKPKIQEIFSNADKKPRLKNENPLELDSENKKKPDVSNTIVGEKTAALFKKLNIVNNVLEIIKKRVFFHFYIIVQIDNG